MLRVALVVLVFATGVAAAAPSPQPLGFADGKLARIDADTLLPIGRARVQVGPGGCASRSGGSACWTNPPFAFSPARTRLVIARNGGAVATLRLVDVPALKTVADIAVGAQVGALWWPRGRGQVIALQEGEQETQAVLAVDLHRRRVLSRRPLWGTVVRIASTPRVLVLLVAPAQSIGAARLVAVDGTGKTRTARLARIDAGTRLLPGRTHAVESRVPGLALDRYGTTAFAVARRAIAVIDLATLAVSYRRPARMLSARTKTTGGYVRQAQWLGGGLLATSGITYPDEPAGLTLVDPATWRARVVDADATHFVVARKRILVPGDALTAYAFDGTRQYEVLTGKQTWIAQIHGGTAFVGTPRANGGRHLRLLDIGAGQIVGERIVDVWLLTATSGGWLG